ncbi:MAG: DNA repair exonuclease [Firmicutes bacterium]|nr:DNA repair exonuclease [Bacillota bacterium]
MLKILHSADWHLDSPFTGRAEAEAQLLRRELQKIPEKVAALCCAEGCELLLLAGDLFDGAYSRETFRLVSTALADCGAQVVISPGNHDYFGEKSPYFLEKWPENVHIFQKPSISSFVFPELACEVFGAGYTAMDCPGLLRGFRAQSEQEFCIGLLHGDATKTSSPYCPVSQAQVRGSGLDYLALGHIHRADRFCAGGTLCAWPGCPMSRGFDEDGAGGVLLVELEPGEARAELRPLNTLRFHDLSVEPGDDALAAAESRLPPVASDDFYRLTFTGYSAPLDLAAIAARFPQLPHLELRDRTVPEADLWACTGEDSMEGMYFALLQSGLDTQSEDLRRRVRLAARISRQILDGQEVELP